MQTLCCNTVKPIITTHESKKFYILRCPFQTRVLTRTESGAWYVQSCLDTRYGTVAHPYAKEIVKKIDEKYLEKPLKILMLGCGGASIPYEILKKHCNIQLTLVDISSEAIILGKKQLSEISTHVNWVLDDAQNFVNKSDIKYDMIINDIFDIDKGIIPQWTSHEKFIKNIYSKLETGGVYIQNTLSDDLPNLFENLQSCFRSVKVKNFHTPFCLRYNIIFTCHR